MQRKILIASLVLLGSSGCGNYNELVKSLQPQARTTVSPRFNAARYERIAIIVLDNTGAYRRSDGVLRQVEDEFLRAAMARGYVLAARSDVENVLNELRFQASGATSRDFIQVGEMLNVSAIVIVSIDESSVRYETNPLASLLNDENTKGYYSYATIGGRMISVAEAEVLWVSSHTALRGVEDSSARAAAVPRASRIVAEALPWRLGRVGG